MYGNATGSTYALTHANTHKSLILTNLETWYANVLSKQSGFSVNQLVDAVWCNDKTVVTGTIGGRTYDDNGASGNTSVYASSKRIMASNLAVDGKGVLSIDAANSATQGLRPAITVVNTVYTNGGDGTATNPYKLYFE